MKLLNRNKKYIIKKYDNQTRFFKGFALGWMEIQFIQLLEEVSEILEEKEYSKFYDTCAFLDKYMAVDNSVCLDLEIKLNKGDES